MFLKTSNITTAKYFHMQDAPCIHITYLEIPLPFSFLFGLFLFLLLQSCHISFGTKWQLMWLKYMCSHLTCFHSWPSFLQVSSVLSSSGQVRVTVMKSKFSFCDETEEVYSSGAYSENLENSSPQHSWYGKGAYIQFKIFSFQWLSS